jgi:hypothetical protein
LPPRRSYRRFTAQDATDSAGTIFSLAPLTGGQTSWSFNLLFSFNDNDGGNPSPLIEDASGNLYGTCFNGGAQYGGVAFELSPPASGGTTWIDSTLWTFPAYVKANPLNGVTLGKGGGLYGSTYTTTGNPGYGPIYELLPPSGNRLHGAPTWGANVGRQVQIGS